MKKKILSAVLCSLLVLSSSSVVNAGNDKADASISAYYNQATVVVEMKNVDLTSAQVDVAYDENLYELVSTEMIVENKEDAVSIDDINGEALGNVGFAFASLADMNSAVMQLTLKSKDGMGISSISVDVTKTGFDKNGEMKESSVTVSKTKKLQTVNIRPFRIVDGKPVAAPKVVLTTALAVEKGESFNQAILAGLYPDAVGGKFFTNSQWKNVAKHDFDLSLDGNKSISNKFSSIGDAWRCDGYTDLFCIIE